MMSGDTLNVKKETPKVEQQELTVKPVKVAAVKPYTATYYPTLLATDIDKGSYSNALVQEVLESILPSNIMQKAAAPSEEELANFRFYEHSGVSVPLEELQVNTAPKSAANDTASIQHPAIVSDSLARVGKDSLALRPAIDSLPAVNIPEQSFRFSDIDSSMLARFDIPELISRDSYILLESHPELVFGKYSRPAQVVHVSSVGIAKERDTQNLGFISFCMLTLGLILFIVSLKFQYKNVELVVKGFYSFREARKIYQSRSLNFKRFASLSTVFYLLTFTVFLVLLVQKYAGNTVKELGIFLTYLTAFGLLLGLYMLRIWAWKMLGNVSRNSELFKELGFNHLVFYAIFALSIFPLQIVASYTIKSASLFFIQLSIYIISIILLLFIVRTLRLFLSHRVSFFFWFLYFCTLEILPVLLALHFAGILG
jgi:hypothetical protein